jgi:hypothetical protein
MIKLKSSAFATVGLAACISAGSALAGSELYDPLSTCTTADCSSQQVTGNVYSSTLAGSVGSKPWVAQIYKNAGECLRIAGVTQTTDIEAVLTCPGSITWRDDDAGGNQRPLIKAGRDEFGNDTPAGWCTLTIHQYLGSNVQGQFTLRFGRYSPATQANCSPATAPEFSF